MKPKQIQKLSSSRIFKKIIDNTDELLNDTDKKLHHNNTVLEGILRDFYMNETVKSAFKKIIDNNNKIISENALFKAVEVIVNVDEEDCN